MDRAELDGIIKERLKSAGLLDYVDENRSQLLEFPEEFFLETVLRDASKLEEANKVVDQLRSDLESRGTRLDPIVRASWKVADVSKQYNGAAVPDVIKQGVFSLPFKAALESGPRRQDVWVEVTPAAYEELARAGRTDEDSLKGIVRGFLEIQLSIGGAGYWDPIRYPRQELNGAAALYTLHHMPEVAA